MCDDTRGMCRRAPIAATLALAFAALSAPAVQAATGGASPPASGGGSTYVPNAPAPPNSDPPPANPKPRKPTKKRPAKKPRGRGPTLTDFKLVRTRLFLYGRPAKATFRIAGRSTATVRVRLYLKPLSGGSAYTVSLASWKRGQRVTVPITGHERGILPDGRYSLRISARDQRGRRLRRAANVSAAAELTFRGHVFPVTGHGWTFGGSGARFGVGRPGHTHQGQDVPAPDGTPLVAPRGGTVKTVAYQAKGAGYYVVLSARGEARDYVFMHLRRGSTAVRAGQRVRTGQRLGEVGATGDASGPHLHFEVWLGGGWYSGGHPVDPLPYLRAWARR